MRGTAPGTATKRSGRRGGERLDVALDQLMQRYVRAFALSDPVQAFHYYAALTLVRTEAATVPRCTQA